MSISHHGITAHPAAGKRHPKIFIACVTVLAGIAVGLVVYFYLGKNPGAKLPKRETSAEVLAELISVNGMVFVQNPGKSEWREVNVGTQLRQGDLVRTGSSGEADIRYRSGTTLSIPEKTVFTVRSLGENRLEISAPPGAPDVPVLVAAEGTPSGGPKVQLQQLVPFGRSLELIGRVEPGNSLAINDEIVDVAADGSYKHFTRPFPESAATGDLTLKVKDLAGRVRIWTATYNFHTDGGAD